jgi:hypothetical protein
MPRKPAPRKRRTNYYRIRKTAVGKATKAHIEDLRFLTALTLELHQRVHRLLKRVDPTHYFEEDDE